jgi:hypothetical protein
MYDETYAVCGLACRSGIIYVFETLDDDLISSVYGEYPELC